MTLAGGDWDHCENYPSVKFEAGPPYRNWLSGDVYEMKQEELAQEAGKAIQQLIEATDALAARHGVPMGQRIDAATVLVSRSCTASGGVARMPPQ